MDLEVTAEDLGGVEGVVVATVVGEAEAVELLEAAVGEHGRAGLLVSKVKRLHLTRFSILVILSSLERLMSMTLSDITFSLY